MGDKLSNPETASSPWVTAGGLVASPNAPLGGGGPGASRTATALGHEGNDSELVPHPQSPVARYRSLTDGEIGKLEGAGVPVAAGQTNAKITAVTLKLSEATGAAIEFDAKDYAELYQQVQTRANTGAEAGSVSRSFDTKTSDVDENGNVGKVTFTIVLTTSLPSWKNIATQPQEHKDKFNTWKASVAVHEAKHVDIYKTEYAKLKSGVTGPTDADITTQADAIDTAADAAQTTFDANKATQPAGLPIPGGVVKVP